MKFSTLCLSLMFTLIVLSVIAQDPADIQYYLRKTGSIYSETLGKKILLNVYNLEKKEASLFEAPVIVYIKGLAAKRTGSESDLSILSDYIKQGYIVITADYAGDKHAISPAIDKDLYVILNTIYASKRNEKSPLLGDIGLQPAFARCFFLPEGYRVATDLVFWEVDKHGSFGTMERVVQAYNEQVSDPKGRYYIKGRSPISSPDELIDRFGNPLDLKLRMDIIYPSQTDKKIPLIFWISTRTVRAPSSLPGSYHPHMTGFPMRGYAYAIIDHCYNPVALSYGHFESGYSLDDINGLKAYTAAIRFIRVHADTFNVDQRYIGGWGHSKGAYAITRLSDPNHAENGKEYYSFKDKPYGSPEPQPWPGYSSKITAGYQSMGNGTRRSSQYVTSDYVPTIVACGKHDQYNHWLDWPNVVNAYKNADANHVSLGMPELGHELPYGYDDELGVDRYELVMSFFDSYLKAKEKPAPVVLLTKPHNQETNVDKSENISIQFAPLMNEGSIVDGEGVKIIADDGSLVEGSWHKSRQGTRFEFIPAKDFKPGGKYKMIIAPQVKNEAGTQLGESKIVEFTIRDK